jgi:hypothetical protein
MFLLYSPTFTVCSWHLNWGRILLEDVTFMGARFTVDGTNVTTAAPLVIETGKNETCQRWETE